MHPPGRKPPLNDISDDWPCGLPLLRSICSLEIQSLGIKLESARKCDFSRPLSVGVTCPLGMRFDSAKTSKERRTLHCAAVGLRWTCTRVKGVSTASAGRVVVVFVTMAASTVAAQSSDDVQLLKVLVVEDVVSVGPLTTAVA